MEEGLLSRGCSTNKVVEVGPQWLPVGQRDWIVGMVTFLPEPRTSLEVGLCIKKKKKKKRSGALSSVGALLPHTLADPGRGEAVWWKVLVLILIFRTMKGLSSKSLSSQKMVKPVW